jgi:hypothetical protein
MKNGAKVAQNRSKHTQKRQSEMEFCRSDWTMREKDFEQ